MGFFDEVDETTKPPADRTAYNPATGNQEYQRWNPDTKSWEWTGAVASRPPAGANVTVQTQPVTSKASMSEADVREQAQKNGGKVDERGGVIVVTWADGSQTRYDPTGTPRDGKVTYNPTYVPPPASSASKQTEFEKRMEALRRGSAPGSTAGTTPATTATPAEPILPQELVGQAGDFQTKGNAGAADPSVREQYMGATAGEGTEVTQKAPIASA